MNTLDKQAAQKIIHSLGESGQPPKLGALRLNVGTDSFIKRLRADYLEEHCISLEGQDGGGTCKWVEADYGNGKTHFLRCMQETAWDLQYVTAFVELSQDECPLDRMDRVYGAIARAVQAQPLSIAEIDRIKGLDLALMQLLDRMFPGVLSGLADEPLRLRASHWVQTTLQNTPVESTSLRTAAAQLLLSKLEGDEDKARIAATYLRGEPVPAAELKQIGAHEKLDKANGFRMLRSMCQLLQRSGLAVGTVLFFDEARRTLSLMSSKSQKLACENLLSVINRCNSGELPGTMFLYAVMPEFFTNFATQYPALQQRCGTSTRIRLNTLANMDESELLTKIGQRITEVFAVAYPDAVLDDELLTADLPLMVLHALRKLSGTGTRRLLVKGWVQVLRDVREGRKEKLTPDGMERLLAGASEELGELETAAVNAEGE
jgi:P-loop Domain of unknown function (DUF2791)